jgi:hypothetical protein
MAGRDDRGRRCGAAFAWIMEFGRENRSGYVCIVVRSTVLAA